jgi:hypothetical protein
MNSEQRQAIYEAIENARPPRAKGVWGGNALTVAERERGAEQERAAVLRGLAFSRNYREQQIASTLRLVDVRRPGFVRG